MRTLVVGAGMAGLTLAGRLAQQGRPPIVVERANETVSGYAIGLYPLGSSVLHGFGTYSELVGRSLEVGRYELADAADRTMQTMDMSVLTDAVGPMLMVPRAALVEVLELSCRGVEIRRGTGVTSLLPRGDEIVATFDDGTDAAFDVVVGADGIASTTRDLVFGPAGGFDSGWVLWTWWTAPDRFPPDTVREWWGDDFFFGVYPAPGRTMCAAGAPASAWPGEVSADALRARLDPLIRRAPAVSDAVTDATSGHRWPMKDVRARSWISGRTALCGDAAAGFLPTAGIGASMAMRAAAALGDELSRADASMVPLALDLYEQRCRRTVERNQTESRRLARLMFLRHPRLAWARDQTARRYPAKRALDQIISSMRRPL